MNRIRWTFFLLLAGVIPLPGQATGSSPEPPFRFEWPRILNHSKSEYGADIQNWSITQSDDGTMYFANNEGLLSYNGSRWNLYPHPDGLIVRALAAGQDQRIYAGSFEDLGYWDQDAYGNMNYHSLKGLVAGFNFHNQEIWRILVTGDSVWFQSFSVVFLLHNNQVTVLNPPGMITSFSQVRNGLVARISGRGLYKVTSDGFILLDDDPFFRNTTIRVILPYGTSEWLVATSDDGVYIYAGPGKIRPWNSLHRDYLAGSVVNRGVVTTDGKYVFGTQLKGIQVFDSAGTRLYGLNQENGMQNNTILGLFFSREGILWAGLDNGIDQIDLQSEISFYKDRVGHIGAVYSVLVNGEFIYAGTNKGLFYSYLNMDAYGGGHMLDFRLIPGTESQVWSLERYGDQLFCGHNDGTFEIQGARVRKISEVNGGYTLRLMNYGAEQYLIQGTYSDPVLYARNNGRWEFSHRVEGFNQPTKYMEADHLGNIWAGHNTRGLYRIEMDPSLTFARKTTYYGSENGFDTDFQIGVFKINQRVVFLNEGKLYTYDDLNDTILPYHSMNQQFDTDERFHQIVHGTGDDYWFLSDRHLILYTIRQDRVEMRVRYPLTLFENRQISNYENLRTIGPGQSILCLDNGLALIPHSDSSLRRIEGVPFFTDIRTTNGREWKQIPLERSHPGQLPELKHQFNSIEFQYASPYYGTAIQFRILLEGLGEGWNVTSQPAFRFDRLPAGNYTLRLLALDGWGNQSEEIRWPFRILEPWYWSNTSRILYVLAFALTLYLIIRYFLKRLTLQEKKLREKQEAEIVKIRNEQLRSEISYKSKELANTTFSIMKKNELMLDIRTELEKELKSSESGHRRSLQKLIRLVDRSISHEEDWKVFESNFERAHEEFLFRIREQFPQLTPGDLKLCAYLRMNLSTKKIALLLGISTRGVENHRYRLRKKLNLPRDRNLIEFMMQF